MKTKPKKHHLLYLLFFLFLGIIITRTLIKEVIREKVVEVKREVAAVEPERAVASVPEVFMEVPAPKPSRSISDNINLLFGLNRSQERIKTTDSLNQEVTLTENNGFGLQAELGYAFSDYFTILSTMSMNRLKYSSPSNLTLSQDKTVALGISAGIRYTIGRYFSLDQLFGVKQSYIFYNTSPGYGNMNRFSHDFTTTRFNYYFFRGNNFNIGGNTTLELLLPIERSNFKTELGHAINSELQFSWNTSKRDAIYLTLGFKYFNLKPSVYKYSGIMGLLGIGFIRMEAER